MRPMWWYVMRPDERLRWDDLAVTGDYNAMYALRVGALRRLALMASVVA